MIPELTELTFYYMNLVTVSRVQRNPTVKAEIQMRNFEASIPVGFFCYPISQAADITAFRATAVPVGEDQLPMLEQCKEIVHKFNAVYGDTLVDPQIILPKNQACLRLPGIESIPFLGKILSGNSLFVYLTLLFVLLLWLFLYKTPYGFWLRASGEKPETLRTAGIDPAKLKWLASILCGVFCALAGAHLSLGQLQGTFAENMSNNRGYIAFACVIFGAANPPKAYLAALMFGFFDAIGLRLQEYLSADLTNLIPYVITVVMMVYVVVRAQQRKKHRARSALAQKGKSA